MVTGIKPTIHPLLIAASVALTLFCAAGIAAIMGWLPNSMGGEAARLERAAAATSPSALEKKTTVAALKPKPATKAPAAPTPIAQNVKASCPNCGTIESIRAVQTSGDGSGIGAVGGALVGGLLGNQVGGGRGKQAMTVAGAIGGALAGNQIEKQVKSTTRHEILVRMEDGSAQLFHEPSPPVWRNGDSVKIVGGAIRTS